MTFRMDVQHLRRMSLLTFDRSRSKFRVKNGRTADLPLDCSLRRYLQQIWQSHRSAFCSFRSSKYARWKIKMAAWRKFAPIECFFSSYLFYFAATCKYMVAGASIPLEPMEQVPLSLPSFPLLCPPFPLPFPPLSPPRFIWYMVYTPAPV